MEEYGIGTFVYYRRRPFDTDKIQAFIDNFPKNIIRAKGVFWTAEDKDWAIMLEQAGRQITCSDYGQWLASAPERIRRQAFREDPQLKNEWDERYGDRFIKLVFIGRDLDKEGIIRALDACLTDL